MTATIVVAGATGNLGMRITATLRASHDAKVIALVRKGTSEEKLEGLRSLGAQTAEVDFTQVANIASASAGASCVVSALQGLRDSIVGTQSVLLEGAVAAKVPRFIPSDFCTDFTQLRAGENRNYDLRREFHDKLAKANIAPTSIFNGAFAEVLGYRTPLLDRAKKQVGYWSDPDWAIDFTTTDDTAAFTATAAVDARAPRILRIASFQVSARQLAAAAEEVFGGNFELKLLGSRDDLRAFNEKERAAHPEGEHELYPHWQRSQYQLSMFSAHHAALDNGRYPEITCTSVHKSLASLDKEPSR